MRSSLLLPLVALVASACAITQNVRPVSVPVSEVCVKNNPRVHMSSFHEELRSQIGARGIKTRTYEGDRPPNCRFTVEYTANWHWDLAMYLTFAEVNVFDNGALVGQASYDARRGGGNMNKFGATGEKLRPLIDQLFPRA